MATQRGVSSEILPIIRRYRADRMYQIKCLNGKFTMEKIFFPINYIMQNKACQLYSHKCGFYVPYNLTEVNWDHIGDTLENFISDYPLPEILTFDGAEV